MKRGVGCWLVPVALAGLACSGGAVQSGSAAAGRLGFDPAAAPTKAIQTSAPFAAPGERMTYRLSLHGVEVAAFGFEIGDLTELAGKRTIVVEAGVQSTGIVAMFRQVRTDFTSWVDVTTGRAVLGRVVETAGVSDPTIETSEARFHQLANGTFPIALIALDGKEVVEHQVVAGSAVWDVPSILLHLRGWEAEVGAELTTEVVRSRYLWRGRFKLAAKETVVTELGQQPTVRIDGVARRVLRNGKWEPSGVIRNMSLWITDDADRVPVLVVARTDFGDIRMTIVDYAAGRAPTLRGAPQ